ncbi:hypothetical protein D3C75_1136740 [compost metagenome]
MAAAEQMDKPIPLDYVGDPFGRCVNRVLFLLSHDVNLINNLIDEFISKHSHICIPSHPVVYLSPLLLYPMFLGMPKLLNIW